MNDNDIKEIEKKIGYKFKDKKLLLEAFTHSSYDIKKNNERFEFFGDSILNFLVSKYLMEDLTLNEGEMTEKRKMLVQTKALKAVTDDLDISKYLKVAKRLTPTDKMKESLFEALLAAMYYDCLDINLLEKCVVSFFKKYINVINNDYKSKLNELFIKKFGYYPIYNSKEKVKNGLVYYDCKIEVEGSKTIYGIGSSTRKKEAEQIAAANALQNLN